MTTPTPEQIEAGARALFEASQELDQDNSWDDKLPDEWREAWRNAARDTIVAAAAAAPIDNSKRGRIIAEARRLGQSDWCLSVPQVAKVALNDCANALEAATVEPEWEYALRDPGTDEPFTDVYRDMQTLSDCESSIVWAPEELVRRRKAGAWELVGGENNGDS